MAKVHRRNGESFDNLVNRFMILCKKERIFRQILAKECYISPNEDKKKKQYRKRGVKNNE